MPRSGLLFPAAFAVITAAASAGAQPAPRSGPLDSIATSVDTTPAIDTTAPVDPAIFAMIQPPADTTTRRRRRAVQYGDWYARRLTIHRIGSYTMLPLFATQYVLGDRILTQKRDAFDGRGTGVSEGTRTAHQLAAGGVATLFGVNTVTGLWNLYESRQTVEGRRKRTVHAVLMLAADAGFVATGVLGARAGDRGVSQAETHRNVALGSMALSTASAAMMWFFRD